ncbi:MAG TPA: serine hydrolase [Bryobacteraceae bacterium]|nr:serine hydrolase [Bryobacteraceae bacterium]
MSLSLRSGAGLTSVRLVHKPVFAWGRWTALLWLALCLLPLRSQAQTGIAVPELESFDQWMPDYLNRWNIRGASLAVAKDGRLVFARGYGLADVEAREPVEPESLFRIASVSKTLTAAGILKLVDEGKLDLEAKAFRLLDHLTPPPNTHPDPRLFEITVRQLLHHTGGFVKDKNGVANSNDPMRPPMTDMASDALGVPRPASPETIIRFMMGRPLDFDPGTDYAYSSFGYCVLGRIIEKVSGQPYADYVQQAVLAPSGISRMRLGRTRLRDRAPGEVRYYSDPMPLYTSVYGEGLVPFPYGAFSMEGIDASGGWIASAMDLVRFASALDGLHKPAVLKPEIVRLMLSPPSPPVWSGQDTYYGLGWHVRTAAPEAYWWHFGGTPYSSSAFLGRLPGGICLAVVLNGHVVAGDYWREMQSALTSAAENIAAWPAHDLSPRYYAEDAPSFSRTGVVNAASFAPGPVAPGEIVTIFGERLGPAALTLAGFDSTGLLEKTAGGTRVLFDGVAAPVVHSFATQVSAIVPYAVAAASTTEVIVEYQGVASRPVTLDVAPSAPGLFMVAVNSDQSLNSELRPAARGEDIVLYATGEGQTNPPGVDGKLALESWPKPVLTVEASIGGQSAKVVYAGAAPGMVAGLMQVNLRIPLDVQPGNAVPVVLLVGSRSSAAFPIAVR